MGKRNTLLHIMMLAFLLGCSPDANDVVLPPHVPENLTATVTNTAVTLSWSPVSTASSYNVYWDVDINEENEIDDTSAINNKETHFTHSNLQNGKTYWYAISSLGAGGESARTAFISATPVAPPAAPAGITVRSVPEGGVSIWWPLVDGADSYELCASDTLPVVNCSQFVTKIANPYSDSLFSGDVYYFTLIATNAGGKSEPSPVHSTILPPKNILATPGDEAITLQWDSWPGATRYNVYMGMEAGVSPTKYVKVHQVSSTTFSYPDPLLNDTTYYFRLTAANDANESVMSSELSTTPQAPPDAPVSLEANPRDETITLHWSAVNHAAYYNIYQSTDPGVSPLAYGKKYTLDASESLFVVTNLSSGTTYYFFVTAMNSIGGEGLPSNTVLATPIKQFGAAGGRKHFCAVNGGVLWCWDEYNDFMNRISDVNPMAVEGGSAVWTNIIEAGDFHTCAVKKDLSLWCWGANNNGQLGIGTVAASTLPQQVGDRKWRALGLGFEHSCGIQEDKSLWCWGNNSHGQVGVDNGATSVNLPLRVGDEADWESVSSEYYHNCAIKTDGSLWCWGRNIRGQINCSGNTNIYTPVMVGDHEMHWSGIALGYDHTCGLQHDDTGGSNTAWCWGRNSGGLYIGQGGELGDGTTINRCMPGQVVGQQNELMTGWAKIAVGDDHACAIRSDKSLWVWGQNYYGNAHDGSNIDKLFPERYTESSNWEAVAASNAGCCAVKSDESFWCWNANQAGLPGRVEFSPQF